MSNGEVRWALPAALALLLLALTVSILRLAPPAPKPADAPPGEFAASRARALLVELASDESPRPVGSEAEARTRERIVAVLQRYGYAVREESGNGCNRRGHCRPVRNLVAELAGEDTSSAVALVAHYDSVEAGPGIGDDLSGVAAILEVARILKTEPRPRHSILFLLDEGEEDGLLGADAFVRSSPDAARVKAVVNLEARGTSGPSLMFETGRNNAWTRPLLARVPHPRTSSVFPTIYEYLPNDTDFSVFKRHGIGGFNFAFIGSPANYHTPLDNLAHLSDASLQHHGENALATVRALANADLGSPRPVGNAVFFDLLGLCILGWPASWGLLISGVPLLLLAVAVVRLRRRDLLSAGEIGRGFLAAWVVVVLAALAGFVLSLLVPIAGVRTLWPAHGALLQAVYWALALAVVLLIGRTFRRTPFLGLWLGGWLVWAVLGLITALLLPGASYLFVVPTWIAGLATLFLPGGGKTRPWIAILPALAAAVVWLPLLILFYDGLGSPALWLVGTLLALALTPLLPLAVSSFVKPNFRTNNRNAVTTN